MSKRTSWAWGPPVCVIPACLIAACLIAACVIGSPMAVASAADAGGAPASSVIGSNVSPDDASSEDIRDIRGPKGIFPLWVVPALIAGAAMLGLAAYAVWRWKRRRRSVRPLLPFEVALQRLEHIRTLMQPASVREFSIAITDIVRHYIEQRFRVTATHRTTEEFLHDLLESSDASLAVHRNLLAEFLHQCDLAKFAGMSLSRQNMESLYYSARAFVQETAKPADSTEEARASLSST